MFKTSDGGESWTPSGLTGLSVWALAIDPEMPTTLYTGTEAGVFKSADGGGSWTANNNKLTNLAVLVLVFDPQNPSRIYGGTGGGGVFAASSQTSCGYSISPTGPSLSSSGVK